MQFGGFFVSYAKIQKIYDTGNQIVRFVRTNLRLSINILFDYVFMVINYTTKLQNYNPKTLFPYCLMYEHPFSVYEQGASFTLFHYSTLTFCQELYNSLYQAKNSPIKANTFPHQTSPLRK